MWNKFTLLEETQTVNTYGDIVSSTTRRDVAGYEQSVGMKEFYQGQASGFRPEIKVILQNWLDYHGEHEIEYTPFGHTNAVSFSIIRTFRNGDALELTLQREVDVP